MTYESKLKNKNVEQHEIPLWRDITKRNFFQFPFMRISKSWNFFKGFKLKTESEIEISKTSAANSF